MKVISKLKEKNYIFLFDNIKFHQNKELLNLISINGHQYIFTPNYSPDLNPIENVNGILKQTVDKLILNDISDSNIIDKKISSSEIKEKRIDKNKKLKEEILKIKNDNITKIKSILKEKNIDKKNKKKIMDENKNEIKNIIKKIKTELNNELKKNIHFIKHKNIINYISKAIEQFNLNYDKEQIRNIYKHAFNFDYTLIKKELKDRIIFTKIT
jgi:transposase